MNIRLSVLTLSLGLVLAPAPFSLSAQQGTLTGTVTDGLSGIVLPGTDLQIVGGGQTRTVRTDNGGQYSVQLPAGTYDVVVPEVFAAGFEADRFDNVRVSAGETTTLDLALTSRASWLDGLTVTGGRSQQGEPLMNATQTVIIVPARDIIASPNPSDVFSGIGPVHVIKAGIQASHPVVRGFNNIFSGSLHMLTDYRLAGVPSLRVNLMHFIPSTGEDLERIEVVAGPSSALYGPNTANGIVHFITKSPLDAQGTTVTFGGGERNVFQGSLRSAFLLNENFGIKVSGQYMRGDEWEYVDLTEKAARDSVDFGLAGLDRCVLDKLTRGLDAADAQSACDRLGNRVFDTERWGLEARADYRFADDGTIVGTYGRNNSTGIELTGLGAAQTNDWVYEFFQGRVRKGGFFAQAYYNTSAAGDSYLLRDGVALVDQSSLLVLQAQQAFAVADGRQEFTVGADYFATRPESQETIYGSYELMDDIDLWGGYVQSRTELTDQLDFVVAGRLDAPSVLQGNVFSSRAAFVFQPEEGHSIRLSYNRAFSTPSALNFFLDVSGGVAPGDIGPLGYSARAYGSGPNGWSLQDTPGTLRGMRSPFNPGGADGLLTADAGTMWQMGINALEGLGQIDAGTAALLRSLPAPTNSDIERILLDGNTGTFAPLVATTELPDILPITEDYTETFEVGWTGLLADRVSIKADVYYMRKNDLVSPLIVETPLLFLDEDDLVAYLTPFLGAPTATALGAGVGQSSDEKVDGIPLGVVSSDQVGAQGADLILSYRNVGDLDLWGADFAFEANLNSLWTLGGSYSHMSEDYIPITGGAPIALNAPKDKGSLSLSFRDVSTGFSASGRARFTSGFPAQSADFLGTECITGGEGPDNEENCVNKYAIFDINAAYEVPNTAATLQFSVNNLLDTGYRSFPGVPKIGRFAMLRVRYELF